MSVSTQMGIRDRMSSALDKITRNTERVNTALRTTDALTRNAAKQTGGFSTTATEADRAAERVENFNQKQRQARESAGGIFNEWGKIKGAIQGAMAAMGAQKILTLADTMTTTRARLDLMNDGLQTTKELQNQIMDSANRSRAYYQTTADAVSKMGIMAADAFGSNQELIAFSELINKQFTIAGTSAAGIDAAMLQLTQAMASGVLRGEELNSVFEQAPTIIQTIAKYLDVPIGKIREMAADGEITASIVKNAMLSSADEINAKFESMPMTFSQVGTLAANALLRAFDPAIQAIGRGAQWIYNNWDLLAPVFFGAAVALGVFAVATGISTAATWLQVAANRQLLAEMLANPFLWIALAIGVLVALIYKWIQSVGGIKIAWMIFCDVALTAWDNLKIGFIKGVYSVQSWLDNMSLKFKTAGVNIANFMGDMKANVLTILQGMVNGAIDIINGFIGTLNKIPGVSIELIDQVTFGTTAQLENEAAKQGRASDLAAYQNQINSKIAQRDADLAKMQSEADNNHRWRQMGIDSQRQLAATNADDAIDWNSLAEGGSLGRVDEVGKIDSDINIADEDLKFLRDVAEMRFVQNFVTLTPTVAMNASISEKVDVGAVVGEIERRLEEEFAASAEGVYA